MSVSPAPDEEKLRAREREIILMHRGRLIRKFFRNPVGVAGTFLFLFVVFCAVFAPYVAPHDPLKQDIMSRLQPPAWQEGGSPQHLLGTDHVGRDVLTRLIFGSRISLIVGGAAVAIGLLIGVAVGLIAGFTGGLLDNFLMGVVDLMISFPMLVLALAFVAVLGPGTMNLILVIALTSWARFARLIRGEALVVRERDYVQAAQASGADTLRIITRHILPNAFPPVIVLATLRVATAIITEASLSFLGLGTAGMIPSWGQMIAQGRDYVAVAWWLPTLPGLAILMTVVSINLMGDRLRDVLDPRVR